MCHNNSIRSLRQSPKPYGREPNEPLRNVPPLPELPETVLPETGLGERGKKEKEEMPTKECNCLTCDYCTSYDGVCENIDSYLYDCYVDDHDVCELWEKYCGE